MLTERAKPEPHLSTKEVFQKLGISVVLFDVDSTLVRTAKTYNEQFDAYIRYIHHLMPHFSHKDLLEKFFIANSITKKVYSVQPGNWVHTVMEFSKLCGVDDSKQLAQFTTPLFQIYNEAPEVRKGVASTLADLHSADIKMGVVTHAEHEWTMLKLDRTFLTGFFQNGIHTVDVRKAVKSGEDWQKAVNEMGYTPDAAIAVGDNRISDVEAAYDAGFKYQVLIRDHDSIYPAKTTDLPTNTIVIEEMDELIPQLMNIAAYI